MQLKNTLGSLVLAVLFAGAAGGCVVTARGHVAAPVAVVEVDEEPPPPRVVMEYHPGFVTIEGRWVRNGGRWVWRDGYYERERAGYAYEQGRWERRGNRHVWVEGRWGAHAGGPAVREHREERREERREGPVVRDHR